MPDRYDEWLSTEPGGEDEKCCGDSMACRCGDTCICVCEGCVCAYTEGEDDYPLGLDSGDVLDGYTGQEY
jgi:hypothetical protein